jgi:hypothetical protein
MELSEKTIAILCGIAIVAVCFSNEAKAGEFGLVAHGFSHHTQPRKTGLPWNSTNEGVALRYIKNSDWSAQAGVYRDSVFKPTVYALVDYTPLYLAGINFGGFVGAKYSVKAKPIAGVIVRWEPSAYSVATRIAPAPQSKGAVYTLEFGLKF